ncbi:DUF3515 family protein [Pseudolysinimonas sp.]|uniref:DUF3515 family protein n=1 Tax=Pseudolysinimonas sp. TaxID=2680009 RepID=UPI00286C27E1|nr:DUF3515 family protein [Pseudolysinimonas sp.]
MRPRPAAVALAAASVACAVVLAGCSPVVSMAPAAEFANDPECAEAIVRLPDPISSYELRQTDAQGAAAWGEPTVVLLYCGVPVPEVSELPCVPVAGIFWLREEVDAGFAYTTYGRDPAVRVVVDPDAVGPGVVLDEIANAVSYTSENGRECVDLEDTVTGR